MKTNKELKQEYLQKKLRMGVFQIRNKTNNKIFIESSSTLDTIYNRHKTQLKFNVHPNEELQKDWNIAGEENFVFEILGEIEQDDDTKDYRKEVKTLETMFIEELQPFDEKGYNRRPKK